MVPDADVAVAGDDQDTRAPASMKLNRPLNAPPGETRDVVDAVFVGDVVEALELPERAVLVVEQRAGIGGRGVPHILTAKPVMLPMVQKRMQGRPGGC